ncbi:hypothetical protein BDP27DRAFT_1446478 [Rhodocollybia butyracea]|uniref:Telomere-associated protein Rif1 N-terminal domain-containing protein n=1 Tax=Rhodocollybia butyracea TaxID=206335 RepID=A0A9P5PZQ2_9AGAR|nr:hypothetical protein BDP27DRAFT_1446478 [Rhodocollybia butyracea]
MSLPTPPTTSHRDKENRTLSRNVAWSKQNQFHSLSTPPQGPSCKSASQNLPVKSILKQTQPILPLFDQEIREETPEPSTPLNDAQYLQTPISTIISEETSLSDLIRAYNVLAARIRPHISDWTDSSLPLFAPLCANRDILCDRVCRDVERALEDALADEEEEEQKAHRLPSPSKSPKKKKRGMSAEQAKHARDLCTICHSVLKFLGLLFSLPSVYKIFTNQQLAQMLSSVLAIPLAEQLPTPNARKTYALSIYVIQLQRLPEVVLGPASDTIAHALGRGIDGELGKEGKKGSATDGLKAIHDLSTYQPSIFIPSFVVLMDSVLSNLLAPILTSESKLLMLSVVLLKARPPCLAPPSIRKDGSPTKTSESDICRTLRTTLNIDEPVHVAHGPVWALHVLDSFIVLLGSAFKTNNRVRTTIHNLLNLMMRHKKLAVRKLGFVVWRSIVWSWHQPMLPPLDEAEVLSKEEIIGGSQKHWVLVEGMLSMGVGISICYAIVGTELTETELMRLDRILTLMVHKSDDSRNDALRCITQLVSLDQQPTTSWDIDNLLSRTFLSGIPGVLTAEYQELSRVIPSIRDELPHVGDIRSLTRDELLELGTFRVFLLLWSVAIGIRNGPDSNEDLLMDTWNAILKAVITMAEDDPEDGDAKAAHKLANALYDSLRTGPENTTSDVRAGRLLGQESHFDLAKNLRMVRQAWASLHSLLSNRLLEDYALQLLERLLEFEDVLTEIEDNVREEWASLCVDLILACEEPATVLTVFWDKSDSRWSWSATVRSTVWIRFVHSWQESKGNTWDGLLSLLTTPFCCESVWDLNTEELSTWERFLTYIVNRGLDYGMDAIGVVNSIAERLQQKCNPTFTSLARIADMLMTHVEEAFKDLTVLPDSLVDFIADTLNQSYPPSPSTKYHSTWMIRTLSHLLEACPDDLCLDLLESLQESAVLWISDERSALVDTYDEIITFYENLLMRLGDTISCSQEQMQRFAPTMNAIFIGSSKPIAAFDAFDAFWHTTSLSTSVAPEGWPEKVYEYIHGPPRTWACSSSPKHTPQQSNVAEEPQVRAISPVPVPEPSPSVSRNLDPELRSSPVLEFPESPTPVPAEDNLSLLLSTTALLSTPPRVLKVLSPLFTPETPTKPTQRQNLAPSPVIKPLPPASPSLNKRQRISDKENTSPFPTSSSPSRRDLSLQRSPPHRLPTTPRKRLFADLTGDDDAQGLESENEKEEERARKRVRISTPIPPFVLPHGKATKTKSPEMISVASASEPSSSKTRSRKSSTSSALDLSEPISNTCEPATSGSSLRRTGSKKRKAIVMDCVEIVRMSLKKSSSIERREMKTPTNRLSRRVSLGKKRSKTITFVSPVRGADAEGDPDPDVHYEEMSGMSCESDDSSDSGLTRQQLSSDDDPHLGQVTPGHLISPALRVRRERDTYSDPPSDDSDCSLLESGGGGGRSASRQVSPSREVVMRRMQRSLSGGTSASSSSPRDGRNERLRHSVVV